MLDFYLFRLTLERDRSVPLFTAAESNFRPDDLIISAIEERPKVESRDGNSWRIGNVQRSAGDVLLEFGRLTQSVVAKYNEIELRFVDTTEEQAPYTFVVVDSNYQICAIAKRSQINQNIKYIAKNFALTLNSSAAARKNSVIFILTPIFSPEQFIQEIHDALIIKSFMISYRRPNPWDVEKDFIEPAKKLVEKSNAEDGKTQIKGQNLEKSVIEQLARSAASTGNEASVLMRKSGEDRFYKRFLSGTQAEVSLQITDNISQVVSLIRSKYFEIRRD